MGEPLGKAAYVVAAPTVTDTTEDKMRTTVARGSLRLLLVPSIALLALACSGDSEPTPTEPTPVPSSPAVGLSISSSGLSLIVGGAERLTARAYDAKDRTINASFEWSSADPAIATVGKSDGTVTAISAGSTTVTAAAGALRATATVSVLDLAGLIAFTRRTWLPSRSVTSDVLAFSFADPTMRSLPRPFQSASIAAPAWSDDGTQLAVEVIHVYFAEDGLEDYNSDLYVLDAAAPAGSPWRALTTNGLSKAPSWSPDGKRIAYLQQQALWSNNHIYILDAAGGAPVRLTRTEGEYSRPRWSPDGTRLVFSAFLEGGSDYHEIFIVNADGSGLTNLTTRSSASGFEPSWSPDGARLTFVSTRDNSPGTFRLDVFVVDVDGSNVRRLTSLGVHSRGPAWSPDGRQIIFSSGGALYVMNADGSALVRLTTPPVNSWDSAPVWRR